MTTQMSLTEIMFALVRAAVLDQEPSIPANTIIDWDGLMDISQEQGLIAWVYDGICKLPSEQQPPRLYRINWGMSAQDIWDRYEQQKKVLDEMIGVCHENNMRLLLMKGIGLSGLYPKPQSRPSGDIDVFLFDDYEKGNVLFGDGVNVFVNKHAAYDYHGAHVENHVTPLDTDTEFERRIGAYLQSEYTNVCLRPEGYYTFSPMANLIYLVTHTLHHFNPNQAVPIRNIIDIIWFTWCNKLQLHPRECYQVMSNLKLDSSFELFITMGEIVLGIDMPDYHFGCIKPKHIKDIRDYILRSGPKLFVAHNNSKDEQYRILFDNYGQARSVYKYLPSKKDNLFFIIMRHNVALFLKHLFKIPEDVEFSMGLKSKIKKYKKMDKAV